MGCQTASSCRNRNHSRSPPRRRRTAMLLYQAQHDAPRNNRVLLDDLIEQYADLVFPFIQDRLTSDSPDPPSMPDAAASRAGDVTRALQVPLSILYALGARRDFFDVYDAIQRRCELADIGDHDPDPSVRFTAVFNGLAPEILEPVHELVDRLLDAGLYEQLRVNRMTSFEPLLEGVEGRGEAARPNSGARSPVTSIIGRITQLPGRRRPGASAPIDCRRHSDCAERRT